MYNLTTDNIQSGLLYNILSVIIYGVTEEMTDNSVAETGAYGILRADILENVISINFHIFILFFFSFALTGFVNYLVTQFYIM